MAEMPQSEINEEPQQEPEKRVNLTNCTQCENVFSQDNMPKLLPCLHTACQACLTVSADDKEKGDGDVTSKTTCPTCNLEIENDAVIDNPFISVAVTQDSRTSEDGSPSTQKFPICTSCDDNQKASSFCMECQEWLCDPCVIAHKRVRITKDHTFSTKMEVDDTNPLDSSFQKQVFCDVHKTEKMKLFCLTCDKLTCRDCQLLGHKDHKYQFIEETIADQKKNLLTSVEQLKARLDDNEKTSERIASKEKDIKKQQIEVFNEVRQVADMITNDLIRWCKQLLNFLQGVCNCRTRDLSLKKKEFDEYAEQARHCIKFVESAIESGNDMSVLSVKGLMDSQLKILLDKDISIQNSMFELNIKYENDVSFLKKNVSKMGFINVNGKSYPTNNTATVSTSPKPAVSVAQTAPIAVAAPNTASSHTPSTVSQQVVELLNTYPPHIKEKYKVLPSEQRRAFLQKLVANHIMKQGNSSRIGDLASYLNVPVGNGQAASPQQSGYNSDSNAIQELYRISQQRSHNQGNTATMQDQTQRSTASAQNSYPNYRGDNNQAAPASSPTGLGPLSTTQPGFNWPGFSWSVPQNYYYNRPNPTLTNPTSTVSTYSYPGVKYPPIRPKPPPTKILPAAAGVPAGRFNIDPLNLRLKQEPRDDGQYRTACQYDARSNPPAAPTRHIQSPPSSVSPLLPSSVSPLLRASPSTQDGGQPRTTESPALPDVNVMDSDRNAKLQGLSNHPSRSLNMYNLYPKHDPSDPSEDYCSVCHNGGDLLCCDRCPKVFHLQCHIPAIQPNLDSSVQWTCTLCTPEDDVIIETPVVKEFEMTGAGKRKAPSGLTDKELKVCERILLELFCLETSTCFHEPVSKQVPNYYKIITNPMDFGSIKLKLRRGHFNHYNTIESFLTDIKLVFKNCFTYNNAASEIYGVGKNIEAFFETLVQTYLPSYVDFIHRDIPSPVGSTGSLETNGDAPRQKKRRSPAPDASRDSPLHFS